VTDILAGTVDMLLADVPIVLSHIRSGALRALAVTATERLAVLPDLPTMEQAGAKDVVSDTWYALFAPAGTPPERIAILHDAAASTLRDEGVHRSLTDQGGTVHGGSPEALAALVRAETAKWGEVIRVANIRLD
jgi:tripartite-type tricarboxylate transporter receptor subunit TctC